MHLLLTIVAFIFIFSLLILIHELGHFTAAKRAGVKVEEFGFGLPPRLFGVKRGETIYSVNWIPFGGFVRMLGEDDETEESRSSKRSYSNQPFRVQAWIVCAGVVMNFLLSFVLLTFGFLIGIEPLIATQDDFLEAVRNNVVHLEPTAVEGDQTLYVPRLVYSDQADSVFHGLLESGDVLLRVGTVEILTADDLNAALGALPSGPASVEIFSATEGLKTIQISFPTQHPLVTSIEAGSPSEQMGLHVGDTVLNVGSEEVHNASEVVAVTQTATASVTYTILREGETQPVTLEIPLREEDGRIGVGLSDPLPYYGNLSLYSSYALNTLVSTDKIQYGWKAPFVAVTEMWRLGKLTASSFVNVLSQFVTAQGVPEGVSGPVGIAQMTGITITQGLGAILRFVAMLSLSLGVINILPFPALDGGHFALIVLKAVSGKKTNPKWERVINTGGFFFLLMFILYVTFNDVLNLF